MISDKYNVLLHSIKFACYRTVNRGRSWVDNSSSIPKLARMAEAYSKHGNIGNAHRICQKTLETDQIN
jgi:hypothetical protein